MHINDKAHEFSNKFLLSRSTLLENSDQYSNISYGPFYFDQNSHRYFDLRHFQNRFCLLGYNHPLEIKSKVESVPLEQKDVLNKIKNTFLPNSSVNIQFTEKASVDEEIITPWQKELKSKEKKSVMTSGLFGIGFKWYESFKTYLDFYTKIHVHNFLPLDFVISNDDSTIPIKVGQDDLYFTNLVIDYFQMGPFYQKQGRFDQINSWLNSIFNDKKYDVNGLTARVKNFNKELLKPLGQAGVLANHYNGDLILSFPTSILEEHVQSINDTVLNLMR